VSADLPGHIISYYAAHLPVRVWWVTVKILLDYSWSDGTVYDTVCTRRKPKFGGRRNLHLTGSKLGRSDRFRFAVRLTAIKSVQHKLKSSVYKMWNNDVRFQGVSNRTKKRNRGSRTPIFYTYHCDNISTKQIWLPVNK